jgi:hypothetical protein
MNFAEAPKIFLNQIKRVVALDIILPKIILVKQIKIIKGVAYLLTSSTQYILFE